MTAVALVRFKKEKDSVICTYFEEENNKIIPKSHDVAPKYDMSKIKPIPSIFRIPEEKYAKFIKILKSSEGNLIVNNLKNKKTDEIINSYLNIKKKEIEPITGSKKRHYNLLYFIEDMIAETLGETINSLPRKLICLTKEDIYKEFQNKGLI